MENAAALQQTCGFDEVNGERQRLPVPGRDDRRGKGASWALLSLKNKGPQTGLSASLGDIRPQERGQHIPPGPLWYTSHPSLPLPQVLGGQTQAASGPAVWAQVPGLWLCPCW